MATYNINIDHTLVPSDQVDFPVYVRLNDLILGMTQAQANSIRVYADVAKTIELPREIVSNTEMHFKAPNISSAVDTDFYIDIDGIRSDYAVTDTYGAQAVWTGYGHVWHFSDRSDSTNAGASLSGLSPTQVTGPLGSGMHINRVENGGFSTGLTSVFGSGHWTVSAWINSDAPVPWQCLVNVHTGDALMIQTTGNQPGVYDGSTLTYSTPTPFGSWVYFTWTRDSNTNPADVKFYKNGTYIGIANTTMDLYLNYIGDGLGGSLDNLYVTQQVRSEDWITTEYNNQSNPKNFYQYGIINSRDGYAYMYENVGYSAPNSGEGYGYSYENVGYSAPNSGEGYGYSYENVGYSAPNSGEGYGYSYENVTLYVIDNDNMLPPTIN